MKALDNLENYDIPFGFSLTAEQEVQFASDLKEIVYALIPLRGSKLNTRRYFISHLRFSSNVQDFPRPCTPDAADGTGDLYIPQPGEYTWDSDLLQPALLDILKPDEWSFGFVINYINADMAHRQKNHYFNEISDELVKFSLAFDIDDIRAQAKSISNLRERVIFLNSKNTDYKIHNGLSCDEQDWVWEVVGAPLKALLEEAEKELMLFGDQPKQIVEKITESSRTETTVRDNHDQSSSQSPVLYDLSICTLPQFSFMRIEIHGGCLVDSRANTIAFESIIDNMFRQYFDCGNNSSKDAGDNYPGFVLALLDAYSVRVQRIYRNDPRNGLKQLFEWMQKTTDIIDAVYQANAAIPIKQKTNIPGKTHDIHSIGAWPLKQRLLNELYRYFRIMYSDIKPEIPESLAHIVPYNLWDAQYNELRARYANQFGLEFAQRAVVRPEENRRRFSQVLAEQALTFCQQISANSNESEDDRIFRNCLDPMTSLLHGYFADYIKRAQVESKDAVEIDLSIIAWLLALQAEVYDCYATRRDSIRRQCGNSFRVEFALMRFFFDICEKNVFGIAVDYFLDSETIPLVPEINDGEQEPDAPMGLSKLKRSNMVQGPKDESIIHCKTVDYETLYNEWADVAFVNISLEEFTHAIDHADFSILMERAKDKGPRAGYIGGVKFIMKSLRDYLGANWYDNACSNINETVDSINKLNDGTRQIRKINLKNLPNCIK